MATGPSTCADDPLHVALVGTRGVPAAYGGFETAVEEVGRRLVAKGHRVSVYCRSAGDAEPGADRYLGMELVHLPALRRQSLETLSHTGLSVGHLLTHGRPDAAVLFNAANAPWLPLLRAGRIPVATHVDGLEWKRAKWGPAGRRYYRAAESLAVRWSDALIADAPGIARYYRDEFGADTELISYGAPLIEVGDDRLAELGLDRGGYHLVVARFEPENHVALAVEGYRRSSAKRPLVVVGSSPYSDDYTRRVHAAADDRVRFLGGVYDQGLLDQLYGNALLYLHGHSVGGTNPSLLRAMGAGTAVGAFDVDFNRDVLGAAGTYFRSADEVAGLVTDAEADVIATADRALAGRTAAAGYDWDLVADAYEALCRRLRPRADRPSGRRLTRVQGGRRHA